MMSKEVEMKEVELNELDQEKQPMTGESPAGTEKNGSVKVKVPEDNEVKFTGLGKDELMRVAGTAGWIRTRWILLVLFWLGWVGMLAGAVVIIVQAPRCKPIPEMNWWNEGPLYQISDVNAFTGDTGLKGVEDKLDSLGQLKLKGLILGPIHTVQKGELSTLNLMEIDPILGSEKDLDSLLSRVHKKGLSLVLDLTPNFQEKAVWFNRAADVAEDLKAAIIHWASKGVDGVLVSGLEEIAATPAWPATCATIQANRTEGTKKIALMGAEAGLTVEQASHLLNRSGVDLFFSGLPEPAQPGQEQALAVQQLYAGHRQTSLAWALSGPSRGLLASLAQAWPIRLYHMLLFTLPGTPVFSAGDEVGLHSEDSLDILWNLGSSEEETNDTAKALKTERVEVQAFFQRLSDLRVKERALLHGDYVGLHSSASSLAYLRLWDQSDRFLTAINWGDAPVTMTLNHDDLPAEARVLVSTDPETMAQDSMVSLKSLVLGPKRAVLLLYPFTS